MNNPATPATALIAGIDGVGVALSVPAELGPLLDRRLRGPRGPQPSAVDIHYAVTDDGHGRHGLERDHGGMRHNLEGPAVVDALVAGLADAVHQHRPDLVIARGAAVDVQGRGLVVLGPAGAGTTTLADALVDAGASLLSDGLVALDRFGRVHPIVFAAGGPTPHPGETATRPAASVPVSMLVTTEYRPGVGWDPDETEGTRAALGLLERVVPGQQGAGAARTLLGRLARHVVHVRGARPDVVVVAADLVARAASRPVVDVEVTEDQLVAPPAHPPEDTAPHRTGWLVFEDFLPADDHARLLEHALSREAEFVPSQVLTEEVVDDPADLRRSATVYELGEVWDLFERRLVALLPHIRRELGIDWFDLGPIERQLTAHGDGDHFTLHIDNSGSEVAARVVSFVYYFNRRPRVFSGGELRLFDTVEVGGHRHAAATFAEVVPADNSLVVFPSDAPHEVRPVRLPGNEFSDRRFTIVCWARRAPTPAEVFTGDAERVADRQLELLPSLTDDGWQVVETPSGVQDRLAAAFEAGLASASNEGADEVILPTGSPSWVELGDLGADVHDELLPIHQQWCGLELEPTAHFGLRVYREGQTLVRHTDRYATHVISSVVHVSADVDEPWPLVVEDRYGVSHDVVLEPGQMLLYEGAKLPHSRPRPLRGRHYASIFLHYRPTDWLRTLQRVCRTADP